MLNALIENMLLAALRDCSRSELVVDITSHATFHELICIATSDLLAFARKDPASQGNARLIAQGYTSYKAVLHYRLAHWFWKTFGTEFGYEAEELATIISSRGKLQSGAEIHYRCEIGQRFILDHGYGTVIGETTKIGDDCYILNSVTLGATGIAGNLTGKRHPTIGDRVEIGAFARIYGPVTIGDDVFIGPHTLIKEDVPRRSLITMRSENLIVRRKTVKAI